MSAEKAANITIRPNAELIIYIDKADLLAPPHATIISSSGEPVKKIALQEGNNLVNITPFLHHNYSIRVVNGKNTTVQKI
ncbi:MAG: hypothetical protein ABW019_00505 [Chitinophagaceae bacterium]